jgi:septum site-determining protein MinC
MDDRAQQARNASTAQTNAATGAATPGVTAPGAAAPGAVSDGVPQDPPEAIVPVVVRKPLRGGQVSYAQQTDLILMGPVNAGAEVIADGNIHAYGPLRGRALAGAHGNAEACIFCMSLEAELVSIAGNYLMAEDLPDKLRGKPARIFLDGTSVRVEPLK